MLFNQSWPSDAIWWHRAGSTLAQVMAWCLISQEMLKISIHKSVSNIYGVMENPYAYCWVMNFVCITGGCWSCRSGENMFIPCIVQDSAIAITNALEILHYCTEPLIYISAHLEKEVLIAQARFNTNYVTSVYPYEMPMGVGRSCLFSDLTLLCNMSVTCEHAHGVFPIY